MSLSIFDRVLVGTMLMISLMLHVVTLNDLAASGIIDAAAIDGLVSMFELLFMFLTAWLLQAFVETFGDVERTTRRNSVLVVFGFLAMFAMCLTMQSPEWTVLDKLSFGLLSGLLAVSGIVSRTPEVARLSSLIDARLNREVA